MTQQTLKQQTSAAGIGLHSGVRVHATLHPAPAGYGIRFRRTDIEGSPLITLGEASVCDTTLCTGIEQNAVRVRTVEHLLAAISGLGIDNILIEIDAEEIPILDGSSAPWVHLILEAGIVEQPLPRIVFRLKKEHKITHGQSWLRATPEDGFFRSAHIDFDHPSIEKTPLVASTDGSMDDFVNRIGRARTFGFLHQVEDMHARGLAQGGSLGNAMVLDAHHLINQDGMRMPDEFAQHKLLDMMGDLMILGHPLLARIEAYRPGHAVQAAFTQSLMERPDLVERVELM
jgi:UDP-3-O-[3-hydroxymyristoyl] N-acetylglucosamine deacetylase